MKRTTAKDAKDAKKTDRPPLRSLRSLRLPFRVLGLVEVDPDESEAAIDAVRRGPITGRNMVRGMFGA